MNGRRDRDVAPELPLRALEAILEREAPAPAPSAQPVALSAADRHRLAALAAERSFLGVGQWTLSEADRFFLCRVRTALYQDLRALGRGGDGHLSVARFLPTGELRAHKVIAKPKGAAAEYAARVLRSQACAIRPITDSCPLIVLFYEVHDDRERIHTFTELCEVDLHQYIATHGHLDERTAAQVLTLLLRALATLHSHGIVHRDVKAPNIFLRDMTNPLSLTLGDLISSAVLPSDADLPPAAGLPDDRTSLFSRESALKTTCGTPLCISPEVALGKSYGPKVDLWAAGILLYQLFCGRTPFDDARSYVTLYRRIAAADYAIPPGIIPPGAEDLLSKLLEPDPGRRPSAAEALLHPWLVEAAGDFEATPRPVRAGSSCRKGCAQEEESDGSATLVAEMMLSGAQVEFDFATGTLKVAGGGEKERASLLTS